MRHTPSTSIFALAAASFLAAAPLGCDSDDETSSAGGRSSILSEDPVRLHAESRKGSGSANRGSDADQLADQAQRDVETLLSLGDEPQEWSPHQPHSLESPPGRASTPPILWNDSAASPSGERPPGPLPEASEPRRGSEEVAASGELGAAPALSAPAARIKVNDPPAPDEQTRAQLEDLLSPEELDLLLVDVRRALFPRSRQSDQPMRELMLIAATSLIDEETPLNPEAFTDLTDTERDLLAKFQIFFTDLRQKLDGSRDAEEAIRESVDKLQKSLIHQPELSLPTATLCWRVGGFGDYDRFDRNSFLAHSQQQVILYLEIDDFTSVRDEKGEWETRIGQQLEIYSDSDQMPVWTEPWQDAVDVTTKRRRDFFTTQIITLPKALSVGRYHLKIRVRDEHSRAEAEASIAIEMVADPRLAAKATK